MNEESMLDEPIAQPTQGKVYSKTQIVLGTFLGSPLTAIYMVAENYKTFGEREKAQKTWIFGGIGTLIFFALGAFLPESMDNIGRLVPITALIFINYLVNIYQVSYIQNHVNTGGQLFNWGRTVLISIIGLTIMVAVFVFAVVVVLGESLE